MSQFSSRHATLLEELTQALFAMSAFDFSTPIPVLGTRDPLDNLATAVQLLQRELAATAVSASHVGSLLASIPNPTALLDLEGRLCDANETMNRLLSEGWDHDSADFHGWLNEHRCDGRDLPVGELTNPVQIQCWLYGSQRHYLFAVAPLISHFDDVEGYVAVGTDISQRVLIERELQRAKQLADAAALARTTFLANVSHEIRTPLTGILGAAELLQSTTLDPEALEYAHTIHACSEHLLALINDVLDFSRIDSNKLTLEARPFDLAALLGDCLSSVKDAHSKEQVEVTLDVAPELPALVVGDPMRVRQIAFNLLSNALKFTSQGKVALTAKLVRQEAGLAHIRIEVADTGIGIAADRLDKLFDPFIQAELSTAREFGGTGLGLAIVKKLVDLMNGEVGVHSTVGEGSSFWIVIPMQIAEAPRVKRSVEELSDRHLSPLVGAHILLVEDSKVTQKLTSRMLSRVGCEVTVANNGAEALEQLAAARFDLVLMDCRMPVMDGLTAVREYRKREDGTHTPIIALTADAFEEHKRECLSAGMDDYLRKPLHRIELYEKVASYLQNHARIERDDR